MTLVELEEATRKQKVLAWGVHAFTATGVILALMTLMAISRQDWRMAFILMAANIIIDGFDGTLARRAQVKAVLPGFDGALLDNIIDYLTYAFIPAYFVVAAGLVEGQLAILTAAMIVLASAYQFCQYDAKTEDNYFKGFPSYWNIAVYYLFLLNWPTWINFGFLLLLAVLVFVPVKYIYPSRTAEFRRATHIATGLWTIAQVWMIITFPDPPAWLVWGSMLYAFYYAGLSIYLTIRTRDHEATA